MTRHHKLQTFFYILILTFSLTAAHAEIISDNEFKYSLDIPEGYQVENYTEDGMSYIFSHPNIPVTLVLKVYDDKSLNDSKNVLSTALTKLSANFDADSFNWSNAQCAVSSFKMNLDQAYKGWAVAAPSQTKGAFITVLCYAPEKQFDACQQFIISTINSLCINADFYSVPGIITSYAFPSEGKKTVSAAIGGKKITAATDSVDKDAAQFAIDLEYAVLTLYANHNLWKEAWQRYYRMIYRDSYSRILPFSDAVYKSLYTQAENEHPQNADITYAQYLLSWVQTFNYARNQKKDSSDFTSLPATLLGDGNDCDSRSMLVACMLNSVGIDTIMLISREYSHAMPAAGIEAPGQTYKLEENGKEYLFGETTAKITWGMIAQNQSDRSKWIPVTFNHE